MTHPAHTHIPAPPQNLSPILPNTLWERLTPTQRQDLHQALIFLCRQLAAQHASPQEGGPRNHE